MLRLSLLVLPFLLAGVASAQVPVAAPAGGLVGEYTVTLAATDLPAAEQGNAGHWRIGYYADGTHVVRHNGREVVRGTHEVRGDQVIHREQTGPYACDVPGTFTWHAVDGQTTFVAIEDTCAPRVSVMATRPWTPVTTSQADELMNRFAAAWTADDHAAISGMLADDAVYFDAQSAIEGRAAVAESWGGSMQATDTMILTPIRSGVEGRMAYHVGRWQLTADGSVGTEGVYTFVFRRGDDGVWRIISAHVEDANPENPAP